MKQIDITSPVMEKVMRFEKRRSFWWLGKFMFIICAFIVLVLLLLSIAVIQMKERSTLELLTLFREDPEIIKEFWRDTIYIFWEELPQQILLVAGFVIGIGVLYVLLTKRTRMIVWKRIHQIFGF